MNVELDKEGDSQIIAKKLKLETRLEFKLEKLPKGSACMRILKKLPSEITMSKLLFKEIWEMRPSEPSSVTCFGKKFFPKRLFQSYGESYNFSKENHIAKEIKHPYLRELLSWIKLDSGRDYNQILINWYSDGEAYICAHSDDECQLVKNSSIYSFSYGQERDFVVSSKGKNPEFVYRKKFKMIDNSLLIMEGDMQENFNHEVPKRSKNTCPFPRINITFRLFKK